MADPVNGLLAARMDPERRRRIGNALMAYQYDRETPQDAAVTERAGLFPLGTYANGQTGPAWPGLIATPVEKMAQVLRGEITPGTPEFNEAGFDIAGAAMVGGLAAARPRARPVPAEWLPPRFVERGYHGSDTADLITNPRKDVGPWGSSHADIANSYADQAAPSYNTPMVAPVEYRFSHPMVHDAAGAPWYAMPDPKSTAGRKIDTDALFSRARQAGHDGLVIRNVQDATDLDEVARLSSVYAPIKSGTVYSPLTGDLLYANARPGAALGAGLSGASERQGIRAYHGSPHDFDRFDMSKIGTGEGAQAYGHGLYFAESEGVARSYRDRLSAPIARTVDDTINAQRAADRFLTKADGNAQTAQRMLAEEIESVKRMPSYTSPSAPEIGQYARSKVAGLEEAAQIISGGGAKVPGRMYEVNIKANPDDFLDWDKPLSQQSEKVRGALNSIPEAQALQRQPIYPDLGPWRGSDLPVEILTSRSGTWPRNGMSQYDPEISAVFRDAGIPGIKYLDQGSRSAGEGSRNYVVFDANVIEILRKYGLMGMLGAGGMAQELLKPSKPTIPDDAA